MKTPKELCLDSFDAGKDASHQIISAIIKEWQRKDTVRLRIGEVTAQEMRTLQAVLKANQTEI